MTAIEILTKNLIGHSISRFCLGDTWTFHIGDKYLLSQDLLSEDELFLNQWYKTSYHSYQNCIDQADISKTTIVAAHLRKEIIGVRLDELCNMRLEFKDDSALLLPTNVDVVDWQWCLNRSGNDPYMDFWVACFWSGEVKVNSSMVF